MMKEKIGIFAPKVKSFAVRQKGYDTIKAGSIVNTQGIQDTAEDVLERGCVSAARKEIANSY